jgi:hypothetical protein
MLITGLGGGDVLRNLGYVESGMTASYDLDDGLPVDHGQARRCAHRCTDEVCGPFWFRAHRHARSGRAGAKEPGGGERAVPARDGGWPMTLSPRLGSGMSRRSAGNLDLGLCRSMSRGSRWAAATAASKGPILKERRATIRPGWLDEGRSARWWRSPW